jgi:peptide/nickel transport system substrate-binding protein
MNTSDRQDKEALERALGRHLSRRTFLRMVATGSAAAIIAACAPQATPSATTAPTAAAVATSAPAATAAATAAATTAPAATTGAAKSGGILKIGQGQSTQSLDPHSFAYGNQENAYPMFWNALVAYDKTGAIVGDLAEKWEQADPTHLTFALTKGVLFHNGRECTADDVKFSLDRIMDPKTASYWASFIADIDTVTVQDKYTIAITTKHPSASLLDALTDCRIVAKENIADIATAPIGTGPFKVKTVVPDQSYEGERFPDYFKKGFPHLDGAKVIAYRDTEAALAAFKAGEIDIHWQVPPANDPEFAGNANYALVRQGLPTYQVFCFYDCSSAPFNDKNVRKAFRYATDSDEIAKIAYFGRGEPSWTNNFFPTKHWAYNPNLTPYTFDLKKAQDLLNTAGIKSGTTLQAPVLTSAVPELTAMMEVMAKNLAKIGITLQLQDMDHTAWGNIYIPAGKKWPNVYTVNGALPTATPPSTLQFLTSGWSNWDGMPAIQQMISDAESTTDQDKRKSIYWKIQETVTEELPVGIPIHQYFTHVRWSYVMDLYADAAGNLKYQDVWLNK